MRKIFIDCGFYIGNGTNRFKKTKEYDEDFVCYGFDASFKDIEKVNYEGSILSDKAIWTHDGIIDFYESGRGKGRCNGVFSNPAARKENILQVPCINFGKWIIDNFDIDDFIVLKLDIEHAEFEVLQSMIDDGSIKYIDIAYIEFHHKRDPYGEIKGYLQELDSFELRKSIETCYKVY